MRKSAASSFLAGLLLFDLAFWAGGFSSSPSLMNSACQSHMFRRSDVVRMCLQNTSVRRALQLRMQSTSSGEETAGKDTFPVLGRLEGGTWEGEMRYAGQELELAPFVLYGTFRCTLEGMACSIESSVTFPNGKTRVVTMQGEQRGEAGKAFRLDPVDDAGPIYTIMAEVGTDTVLLQEYNKTDDRVVLSSSISVVQGQTGEELVQIAHETSDKAGQPPEGFQIWRMKRHVEA